MTGAVNISWINCVPWSWAATLSQTVLTLLNLPELVTSRRISMVGQMMSKAPILIKTIVMVHEDRVSAWKIRKIPGRVFNSLWILIDIKFIVSILISVVSGDEIVTIVMSITFVAISSSMLVV